MVRTKAFIAALALAAVPGNAAWAQVGKAFTSAGTVGPFLTILSDRIDHTIQHIPKLGRYLLALPQQFDSRTAALLIGIVVAGLLAELVTRQILRRIRHGIFARHSKLSPLRAFMHGALLD